MTHGDEMLKRAVAVAHPNIALSKYWGKLPWGVNLPAVPSLSVTLAGMRTRTRVTLDPSLDADRFELGGTLVDGRPLERVGRLLDLVWRESRGERPAALVQSENDFPTAAGLASSASAFAALAVAANAALGSGLSTAELSSIARRVSASSGRSLFGGFVELPAGRPEDDGLPARQVAPPEHWDLRLVVAVTTEGEKDVGSTEGMNRTSETSPLYAAWLDAAPVLHERVKSAVLARDLSALGPAMEQSALTMHATALAADPGLLYWNGVTVEVMRAVRSMRRDGTPAYVTIDAGPHVKVVTTADLAAEVRARVAAVTGVLRTIVAEPGEGARIVEQEPR